MVATIPPIQPLIKRVKKDETCITHETPTHPSTTKLCNSIVSVDKQEVLDFFTKK